MKRITTLDPKQARWATTISKSTCNKDFRPRSLGRARCTSARSVAVGAHFLSSTFRDFATPTSLVLGLGAGSIHNETLGRLSNGAISYSPSLIPRINIACLSALLPDTEGFTSLGSAPYIIWKGLFKVERPSILQLFFNILCIIFFSFPLTGTAQVNTPPQFDSKLPAEQPASDHSNDTSDKSDNNVYQVVEEEVNKVNSQEVKLSDFLFSIHFGPFFSLGKWIGCLSELEFQFRLNRSGFLSVIGSVYSGYQTSLKRSDYLFSSTIGYRYYFGKRRTKVWTLMGGGAFGYYTTNEERKSQLSFDWMHFGIRAKGGHYWLLGERFSVGLEGGLLIAYQFSEFLEEDPFAVLVPAVHLTLTF